MRLAYTMTQGKWDTDLLLHALAQRLIRDGYQPAGTVQINTDRADANRCDMDVLVLPDGPTVRISQSLGRAARGCRLDASALETAVQMTQAQLAQSDFLIVNKFGKHEAEGRGFRNVIADALERNLPVLVGLNTLNRNAFLEFAGGEAAFLEPSSNALYRWLTNNGHLRNKVA